MKKLLILFGCIISSGAVLASTCETRVDKKWDKTTQDRVNTCLFGEEENAVPQTEVVSSLIYSTYPPTQNKKKATQRNTVKYKKYQEETAFRELVNQDSYPTFKNDYFPQQSDELAHEAAIAGVREHRQTAAQKEALDEVVARQQAQNAKQNVRSKSKTKKKSKTIETPQIQSDATEAVAATEKTSETMAIPSRETADVLTAPNLDSLNQPPAAEVQQAQAIEQDPVAPLPADDDPMKELSLNEDILGPAGFGYNNTDPAFQP